MSDDTQRKQELKDGVTQHEDEPIPAASDEAVIEETARLAREGRQQLESDPKESRPGKE
jgi:hypothetical protein